MYRFCLFSVKIFVNESIMLLFSYDLPNGFLESFIGMMEILVSFCIFRISKFLGAMLS